MSTFGVWTKNDSKLVFETCECIDDGSLTLYADGNV
jgi:hypothetical protein